MTPINTSIIIHKLQLHVHLGWSTSERLQKQTVLVDISIYFPRPPDACKTDELKDTYCYHTLCNKIKDNMALRQFRLIEHLGYEIYHLVKQFLVNDIPIQISITKKPDIVDLSEGVSFCYGDV